MIRLNENQRVMRETDCIERTRPIVVELHPRWLRIGLKGKQEHHVIPWDSVLDFGRRIDARLKGGR